MTTKINKNFSLFETNIFKNCSNIFFTYNYRVINHIIIITQRTKTFFETNIFKNCSNIFFNI